MPQVKCMVIGDMHMQDSNMKDMMILCDKLVEKAKKLLPTFIVVLGDILHTHEKISVTPFKYACEFLYNLTAVAPTYLLIGNHDYKNNQQFLTENHGFNALKLWENMYVIDKVTIHEYNGLQFTFLPYVPVGRFIEALNQSGEMWETTECIFAHQEFYGCKMGSIISEEGDIWDESYPLVVSGHIHDHQLLGANLFYTGSILQHGFGESAKKYMWTFEFNGTVKDGEDTPSFVYKKHDMGMRRKRIISIDFEDIDKFKPEDYENEDIKLDIKGLSEHFKSFRSSKKYKELQAKNIKVSFNPIHNKVMLDLKLGNTNHKNKTYITIFRDLSEKESQKVKDLCEQVTKEYVTVEMVEQNENDFDASSSGGEKSSFCSDEISEDEGNPPSEGGEAIDWEKEDSESESD